MEILSKRFSKVVNKINTIKNIWNYICLGILVIISLVILLFKIEQLVYLIFIMLGFGWSIFFFKKRLNILEHLLISPVLIFILFITFIVLAAFLSIKITIILGFAFVLISLGVFLYNSIFEKENINFDFEKADVLILILMMLAVFAKIYSIREFLIPPLHDPITHAYFAKKIIDTGYIEFFYSPGMHIFSAFNTMFGGENVARQVLFITNFFNGYAGVLAYLYVKRIFKDKVSALVAGLAFSFGFSLAVLYMSAGKNALIIGTSVILFFFFTTSLNRKIKDWKLTLLSMLSLFAVFLTHYPLGVFAAAYLLAVFIIDIKKNKIQNLLIGIGLLLGLLWMWKTNYYRTLEVSVNETTEQILFTLPADYMVSIRGYLNSVLSSRSLAFGSLNRILTILSIIGVLYFPFGVFKSKMRSSYWVFLAWVFLCLLINGVINVFQIAPIFIVSETFSLSVFLFYYFLIAFGIGVFYKIGLIFLNKEFLFNLFSIFFIILASVLAVLTLQYFRNSIGGVSVKETDIVVFDWINENIDKNEKILINGHNTGSIVFSSDAGGWIEVFTGNKISKPFYEYGSLESHTNLNHYNALKEDLKDCEALNYFAEEGYSYYYQGSIPLFSLYLASQEELESNGWEVVFSEESSILYSIPSCEELNN